MTYTSLYLTLDLVDTEIVAAVVLVIAAGVVAISDHVRPLREARIFFEQPQFFAKKVLGASEDPCLDIAAPMFNPWLGCPAVIRKR